MLNTFCCVTNMLKEIFPIPLEYEHEAVYCRIMTDWSKVFYYNKNKKYLCEVVYKNV